LPPSPFASSALSFVNKLTSGQSLQSAALSTLGQAAMAKLKPQHELEEETRGGGTFVSRSYMGNVQQQRPCPANYSSCKNMASWVSSLGTPVFPNEVGAVSHLLANANLPVGTSWSRTAKVPAQVCQASNAYSYDVTVSSSDGHAKSIGNIEVCPCCHNKNALTGPSRLFMTY
jgi:hypothetical protein